MLTDQNKILHNNQFPVLYCSTCARTYPVEMVRTKQYVVSQCISLQLYSTGLLLYRTTIGKIRIISRILQSQIVQSRQLDRMILEPNNLRFLAR